MAETTLDRVKVERIPITKRGITSAVVCKIAGISDQILQREIYSRLGGQPAPRYTGSGIEKVIEMVGLSEALRNTTEGGRPVILPRRIPAEVEFNLPDEIVVIRRISAAQTR